MPGIALLIGVSMDGLSGVDYDITTMTAVLSARGFQVVPCVGPQATRAGILDAYENLIGTIGPDEPAVVYFSGHGGSVQPPPGGATPAELMNLQFIQPSDFHESTDEDFRGIAAIELSMRLTRLTRRTHNATVILDCCHAAHMSRDTARRVRSTGRPVRYEDVRGHLDRLLKSGELDMSLYRREGNPDAVRIVACAPEQSAIEYPGVDGQQVGVLTEALAIALRQAGTEPITWMTVMGRVRKRVLDLEPTQRPEAEGPVRRRLFDLAEDDVLTALGVIDRGGGRVRLDCAPLLGVSVGDTFAVMPATATGADDVGKIGDLEVTTVDPMWAEGTITFAAGHSKLPLGARAYRVSVAAPALPVSLPAGGAARAALADAIAVAPLVREARPDEPWLARIQVDDAGEITVEDRVGPLHRPTTPDAAGIGRAIANLQALARVSMLRGVAADQRWTLGAKATVEWGYVKDGVAVARPASREAAHVGDLMYVQVRNQDNRALYVHLIDIGVAGRIAIVNPSSRSGERVEPGGSYTYGADDFRGTVTGQPLTWPDDLDPIHARAETILVIVTTAAQDLSPLEQSGVRRGADALGPLEQMIRQVATGDRRRDATPTPHAIGAYDVHMIDFELDPVPESAPSVTSQQTNDSPAEGA